MMKLKRGPEPRNPDLRFLEKIVIDEGCWDFQGPLVGRGYRYFHLTRDKKVYAHRYSYELFNGPIPEGEQIHHTCGTKTCVHPGHMETMTQADHARYHAYR